MNTGTRGRPAWANTALVSTASLILAFAVAMVIMVVTDAEIMAKYAYFIARPGDALDATFGKIALTFEAMYVGSLGSATALTETTAEAAPLIAAGLGVALAFRAGLFNIGAQGQAVMGALVGAYLGFSIKGLPIFLHLPLVILAGVLMGALWGGVVGLIKARTGAHEVILTIMMNYVAANILSFLLKQPFMRQPGTSNPIAPVLEWSATLPRVAGTRLHLGFGLALLAALGCWWLLERTRFGLRLQAVGLNPDAAATAGTSVSRVTFTTMALAGGLAGLGGLITVTAPVILTSYPSQLTVSIIGTLGFDAITVALLGRSRPIGVALAGLLFGALKASRTAMVTIANTPKQLVDLIQALIVLLVAAPAFVIWLLPFLKERRRGAVRTVPKEAKA